MRAKANPPVVDRGATEEELGGSDENQVLDDQHTPEGYENASDNNTLFTSAGVS